MSADNYYVVRRDGGRFVVSMGFMSDDYGTPDGYPPPHPHRDHHFDTLAAAVEYAQSEYSEYGVRFAAGVLDATAAPMTARPATPAVPDAKATAPYPTGDDSRRQRIAARITLKAAAAQHGMSIPEYSARESGRWGMSADHQNASYSADVLALLLRDLRRKLGLPDDLADHATPAAVMRKLDGRDWHRPADRMPENPILRAARFARQRHAGQKRKFTGRPYITHPGRVASHVACLPGATEDMVCAAWLHDVVEDCGVTVAELAAAFGDGVARLVGELTNTSKLDVPGLNRAARKALDRDRLRGVSREAQLLKLIDRADNLREIDPASDFCRVYVEESRLLLDAIGDADVLLAEELRDAIDAAAVPSPPGAGREAARGTGDEGRG